MSQIGFINKEIKSGKIIENVEEKDCFLRFDSGTGITFEDAFHHNIVLGTTGCGKTSNVILPMLANLFKKNMCGIIIDIKGNLREKVRAIAIATRRENDIIELGISPTATSLNILANMNTSEVFEFLKTLCSQSYDNKTRNLDFHIRGIKQATECVELLRFISTKYPEYEATLDILGQMMNNPALAAEVFEIFKKSVLNEENKEHLEFKARIESSDFHILQYADNERKSVRNSSYSEQLNYAVGAIRVALYEFMSIPGLIESFSRSGAKGIDMKEMLLSNKIVMLRFEPDSGTIGAGLARTLLERYYEAIFLLGAKEAVKHPSFICLDEYQEIVNLSESRFSDKRLIAIAREYRSCFIASTQSVAVLAKSDISYSEVSAFLTNCNNKFIFYTDDPYTQNLIKNLDHEGILTSLKPGQAFVSRYEFTTRMHKQSFETMQKNFEDVEFLLKENRVEEPSKEDAYVRIELANLNAVRKLEYEAIFLLGAKDSAKHPSFICLDEYQEIVNLTESRFSDKRFIAIAREYRSCFIASTQSVAVLAKSDMNYSEVSAFLTNCNNKFIFYTDDPYTQNLIKNLGHEGILTDLKPGQAFVSRYEFTSRTHKQSFETMQKNFEDVEFLLKENCIGESPKEEPYVRIELANLNAVRKLEIEESSFKSRRFSLPIKNGKIIENERKYIDFESQLRIEFPEFLSENKLTIEIPIGWTKLVYNAFCMFKESGLAIQVKGFEVQYGALRVQTEDSRTSIARTLFNELLCSSKEICVICGEFCTNKKGQDINVCSLCLQKYNLESKIVDEEREVKI